MNEPANRSSALERAWQLRRNGDLAGAETILEAVFRGAILERDHNTAVRALVRQGHLAQDLGNSSKAIRLVQQALDLYAEADVDDDELAAYAVRHLADFQRAAGMPEEALGSYESSLRIYQQLADPESLDHANTLRGYALALEAVGREEDAIEPWRGARKLYASLGIEDGVAECETHLRERRG